jgi:2,3-bisphosphoglycerate-dependent phosphoglycerate mutase
MPLQHWPALLWIVRHGESSGNVARDTADASQQSRIEIAAARDMDVPLSSLGARQSQALGEWFAAMPQADKPNVLLVSPYRRAVETAAIVQEQGGIKCAPADIRFDERLREKEFGILDRLTRWGIEEQFPEQAELRRMVGKFYHRPPGGESWCDVILRLRSALDSLALHHEGARVLVVTHQVVVLCLRYLIEGMTEEQVLAIDAQGDVANCGVTEYGFDPSSGAKGAMALRRYNFVAPLEAQGVPVTQEPDPARVAR